MRSLRTLTLLAALALIAGTASGQVATSLLTEGAPVPGADGYTVDSISNADANGVDGFSFTCDVIGPDGEVEAIWGTLLGAAPPAILRTEQAFDDYTQDSFESFFGMYDGGVAYSASCTRNADGEDGLDSVWLDDMLVAIEEEPFPYRDGWFWRFGSRPGVTRDGVPYFVGGITDVQGGSTQERGLFKGPDGEPVYIGGTVIDGLPDPVAPSGGNVSFDFRFSPYGTHVIAEVQTDTGNFDDDNHIVINDTVITIDGLPLSEGGPVAEAAGGQAGELWDNWDYLGINEAGDWLVTGDTSLPTDQDEFLMINGQIILREGQTLDGLVLDGSMQHAYLGPDGDWACIWDGDTGSEVLEILIVNGEVVLIEGEPVDIDGDLEPDADAILTNITGAAILAVSERDAQGRARVYFTADVETPNALQAGGGEIVRASEENGLVEDHVEQPGSRVELEHGMVWLAEGTVPVENPGQPGDQTPAARLALDQNYPNPFNPQTTIAFSLPRAGAVRLEILDLQGRLVRTLLDGSRGQGSHEVIWNGTTDAGRRAASGTYVYRLTTEDRVLSRSLVLVK